MENINNVVSSEVSNQSFEPPIISPIPKSNIFKFLFFGCFIVLLIITGYFFFTINNLNSKVEPLEQNIAEVTPITIENKFSNTTLETISILEWGIKGNYIKESGEYFNTQTNTKISHDNTLNYKINGNKLMFYTTETLGKCDEFQYSGQIERYSSNENILFPSGESINIVDFFNSQMTNENTKDKVSIWKIGDYYYYSREAQSACRDNKEVENKLQYAVEAVKTETKQFFASLELI